MKAAFYTLGCKVNQYETQIMAQSLHDAGFDIVPPDEAADVFIVNSCTVTAESDRKTRQILRRLKKQNPDAVAVLCGCYAQAFPEKASAIPEADIVAGVRDRGGIAERIKEHLHQKGNADCVTPFSKDEPFEPMRARAFEGHTRAFVKIEDGCRNFCTYCIIPYARGPVRSKPPEAIREELAGLQKEGYAEAVLVGIDLSAYGRDCGAALADALDAARESGIKRLRLGSLSPLAVTDGFLEAAARCAPLCAHFHLSLQSGCAATLRRMGRRYSPEEFAGVAEKLRAAFPGCGLTADVIAGFPGETAEEFAETLAFVRQIGFSQTHVFPYSRRAGTKAASFPGQVPKAVREARAHALSSVCEESGRTFRRTLVRRTLPVLFERKGENGLWEGLSPQYVPVFAPSAETLHGVIRDVLLTGSDENGCTGRLITN